MKNIVISDEYREVEFKPSAVLAQYIRLTEKDVKRMFIKKNLLKTACPGCRKKQVKESFVKMEMRYNECAGCGTLYVSPRPDEAMIYRYYTESLARSFWNDKLSVLTDKKRKEKIIMPRISWIIESTQEFLPNARTVADINTTQHGYSEELKKSANFSESYRVNPFLKLMEGDVDSFGRLVVSKDWDNALKNKIDVVILFEALDRAADADLLFKRIKKATAAKALCFITGTLISGFDLQVLWKDAPNLYPPDRLNIFSPQGLKALFKRHGFECIEFSTPGVLDVEIVAKAVEHNPGAYCRFAEYLVKSGDRPLRQAFQNFLQKEQLSSFGRILIQKK